MNSSLYIAIPTFGDIKLECMQSVLRLYQDTYKQIEYGKDTLKICDTEVTYANIVSARNRIVHDFLQSDASHLLFIDGDIEFTTDAVLGMLAANKPMVAAPYPRRSYINFDEITAGNGDGYSYCARPLPGNNELAADNTIPIKWIGFGFVLLQREPLAKFAEPSTKHTRRMMKYDDDSAGVRRRVSNCFGLINYHFTPQDFLSPSDVDEIYAPLSEDYSFCQRWNEYGNTVHMYLGPGSPVIHHGSHRYVGHKSAFGLPDE